MIIPPICRETGVVSRNPRRWRHGLRTRGCACDRRRRWRRRCQLVAPKRPRPSSVGLRILSARFLTWANRRTWSEFLAETDLALTRANDCGITTAIVLAVTPAFLCGASVGDSEAWLVTHGDYHVLTSDQHRKPFVGDSCAADFVPHCTTAAYWSWPPTGSSGAQAQENIVRRFASCRLTSRARGSSISLACTLAISMMTWHRCL